MSQTIKVPYLYFMDTTNLSDLCPVIGQKNSTYIDIVFDNSNTISVFYKPSDIVACTRSVVFFSQAKNFIEEDRFFSRIGCKFPEAHLFFVSDPYYFQNAVANYKCRAPFGYYMTDYENDVPLLHSVLLKFHELLDIAFCKFIGSGAAGYSALQFNAGFSEIAPWTLTMAINPPLDSNTLQFKSALEIHNKSSIDWSINWTRLKEKADKGKHLFFVAQNYLDIEGYNNSFLKFKKLMKNNGIQGWTWKTPGSTFYNTNTIDHQNISLDNEVVFGFIDWMSYRLPSAEGFAGMYDIKRDF